MRAARRKLMDVKGIEGGHVAVHAIFRGIVQGVYFRANTRREAQRLGLQGWVRNLPDGTVEAWVEGDGAAISRLVEYCRTGIPAAYVEAVDLEEAEARGDYPSFEIVR